MLSGTLNSATITTTTAAAAITAEYINWTVGVLSVVMCVKDLIDDMLSLSVQLGSSVSE